MFSEGVVSKRTKQSVDEQRANSKFDGIYSKRKRTTANARPKAPKLQQAEDALCGSDLFGQLLML